MPLRATVPVPNYKALLASVSFLALLTTGAGAEVRGLRLNAGSSPVTAATGAASASAQQAAAIAKQSMDSLTRAAQAIQAMQTAQAAARNLAAAAGSSVPNGLTPGGLQLAPGVVLSNGTANPNLYLNADLPKQTSAGGQVTVTIVQNAPKAILTWETFNVGTNTTVHFDQTKGTTANGNSWIVLNRIMDPSGVPSQIFGAMLRIVTDDPSVNQANFNTAQLLVTAARSIVDFTVPDYVPFTTSNRADGLAIYREHYMQSGVAPNDGTASLFFRISPGPAHNTLGLTGESGGDMGGCIKGPFPVNGHLAVAPGPVSSAFNVCN